jgi:DNA mismatch endonuclease (patch repair protein)
MRAVKSKNTKPELIVRTLVHGLGFRYRLHRKDLAGVPDLVFPRLRKVIFVHGCFWHGHDCKRGARAPKENATYWSDKIARNCKRDASHVAALESAGWSPLIIWECELKDAAQLRARVTRFLSGA